MAKYKTVFIQIHNPGLNQPYKACRSGLKTLRGLLGSLLNHHNRWASSDLSICLCRGCNGGHIIYPNVLDLAENCI